MGKIVSAYIYPHPPIIIPEIGRGEENGASNTVEACKRAAKDLKSKNPDTLLVITPHGPAFKDAVAISTDEKLLGSFARFGSPDVSLELENNQELVDKIAGYASQAGIPVVSLNTETVSRFKINKNLDHGALVPLYYISRELKDFKIVHICMGFLSYEELYEFGVCIKKAIEALEGNVAVIASGDLSHRLTPDAPCGYSPQGKEFDKKLVGLLAEARFDDVMKIDEALIETAGECGMRPFVIMFGCLEGCNVSSQIFSYEGPFGVGYCVAEFNLV
ncbi:MAG: AmmeMemoRadiSam system protein B [Deltaproteobacteria bacterium]